MKKLLLSLSIALLTLTGTAQITININEPGALKNELASNLDATYLIVTGNIDARDVKCMRDDMPNLATLDLSNVTIVEYTGTGGTVSTSTTYPANEMPQYSFHNDDSNQSKTSLTSIKLPNSITSIGKYAFCLCYGFTGNLTIPSSVTSIGENAFYRCEGFTGSLTIPSSVISIGKYAFGGCRGFSGKLTIPDNVTAILEGAFYGCEGFSGSLIIPSSVTSIGQNAFSRCEGLTGSLTIPSSVTSIGQNAFSHCYRFTSLSIPNSVTSIQKEAFYYCEGLTGSLTIPSSVTSIGENAFSKCYRFTSLSIPNSVTSIGDYAFAACSRLQKIVVANVTPINISSNTFQDVNKKTCELVVPVDSKNAYKEKENWKEFNITGLNNALLVHYNSQGGSTVLDAVAELDKNITAPIDPTKTGYTLTGWYTEATCENSWDFGSDVVTKDTTLYAKWTINTYTVSFNLQNGNDVFTTEADYNTKINAPEAPTKTGYTFDGWYTEEGYTHAWNFDNDVVTTNTTLYAKWTINTYTVSFNLQDGSDVSTINADYKTKINAPETPTKAGYTLGWYTDEAYTNAWGFDNDFVTKDTTLYANWTINTYTVSFNLQDGSDVSTINADYNTTIKAPEAPTKTGYTFAGWYTELACTNAWDFASDLVTNNLTLYAKWTTSPTAVANIGTTKLTMFPNPASESVQIESEKLQTITIYNIKGTTQQQLNLNGEKSTTVNLGTLAPGYYLIKVKTGDGEESIMKLMKN